MQIPPGNTRMHGDAFSESRRSGRELGGTIDWRVEQTVVRRFRRMMLRRRLET